MLKFNFSKCITLFVSNNYADRCRLCLFCSAPTLQRLCLFCSAPTVFLIVYCLSPKMVYSHVRIYIASITEILIIYRGTQEHCCKISHDSIMGSGHDKIKT